MSGLCGYSQRYDANVDGEFDGKRRWSIMIATIATLDAVLLTIVKLVGVGLFLFFAGLLAYGMLKFTLWVWKD